MFTVDQIKTAQSKVKSGADFPAYIREIEAMGVTHYETYVSDGHIDYHGSGNYTEKVTVKYEALLIAGSTDAEQFKAGLKVHQQGKTDFLTFLSMCAACGIEKWKVCMDKMSCTYFDKAGNEVLAEGIPQ
ncbi:DUF1398 domain-containing protein [Daejeonella sp.]|uniref:DUF1398 domain-containing protein n=1 Tax=Daejeonella sp. TaxID=2805397 RepID=UPI0027302979|nr:DUF1398 family protein [Daejeonella sp.]MDP2413854.1 DUF1398 family protein [Daejeonella sp.]